MKKYLYIIATFAFIGIAVLVLRIGFQSVTPNEKSLAAKQGDMAQSDKIPEPGELIGLPLPVLDGAVSLEKALTLRRSVRTYSEEPLSLDELAQLLWSAQGITNDRGFRTAPSAGATFPIEMFVMVNRVEGLKKGIYHHIIDSHHLRFLRETDIAAELARASLSQSMIADGGVVLIFAAEFERTTQRYGERGIRYVYNEIGHASQNVHLQAAALGLGTVVIGAYRDDEVEELLDLGEHLRVLYMMPVGKP